MAIIVGNTTNKIEQPLSFPEILKRLSSTLDLSMVKDSPTVSRYAVSSVDGGNQAATIGGGGGGGGGGSGTVTDVSVVTANGFAGTVANPMTTPAITLETTVTGVIKGDGTQIEEAIPNVDYMTDPMTTEGDVIYSADNSGTPARLGIGSLANVLTVGSSGLPEWDANTRGSITLITSTTTWTKPVCEYVCFVVIGSGGNGAAGASGATGAGGGGGGSGGLTIVQIPSIFVPTTVYVFVNNGPGLNTYASVNNDTGGLVAGNTIAYAIGGANAVTTSGGAAAAAATIANTVVANLAATDFYTGVIGGAQSANATRPYPLRTGGGGGGAKTVAGGSVVALGAFPALAGGLVGSNPSGNGGNGNPGVSNQIAGFWAPIGGTGGGGGGNGAVGSLNGGNGGNGANGSYGGGGGGGGGGGAASGAGTNGTGGTAGTGGGGAVYIVCS